MSVDQCSILYLKPCCQVATQTAALRSLGFAVTELDELPPTESLIRYHAVICRPTPRASLPMIAARLRAKPHFDRRVLIALLPPDHPERARREAVNAGFNCTLPDDCTPRELAAAVIGFLRRYPEHRCLLRAPKGSRRKAAA